MNIGQSIGLGQDCHSITFRVIGRDTMEVSELFDGEDLGRESKRMSRTEARKLFASYESGGYVRGSVR